MKQIIYVGVGDTRVPYYDVLDRDGKPIDIAGLTVKFEMWDSANAATIAETATGVTVHPAVTFTADATNNWLVANDHKVKNGQQVVVSSTTTLPGGLAASTRYFVIEATPNNFQLAATPNGAPIDITSAGSGTHSYYVVGSVEYQWLAADVDTEGRYNAWWTVFTSALVYETVPQTEEGVVVVIFGAN